MTSNSSTYLTQLHERLNAHFNLAEIQDLCFRLNVDYESVSGEEKSSRIRELLLALGRNGRLPELITIAQQLRPNIEWPLLPDDFQLPESLTMESSAPINQYHIYGDWVQGDKFGGDKVMGDMHEHHHHSYLSKKAYDLNTPQNKLNRKNIIANVRSGHIEGVLNQALHKKVRIELELEYDPTALMREMQLWEGQQVHRTIPQQDNIEDVFDHAGQALLILGAPGSGKTIALLELCQDLLKRAEEKQEPVPVVLNLSTWADKKGALGGWIVKELHRLYTLNEKVGQAWLDESQMCLLLDGLDEVAEAVRDACVEAINEFREAYSAPMVVCSRIKDYEELSKKLHLQTAVVIQSLTDKQVEKYLTDKRMKLHAVYEAVQEDDALRELSQVPLNLNVMALAYEGYSKSELRPLLADVDNRRQHLYDAYIVRMFQRRPLRGKKYDEMRALNWLQYLAKQLTRRKETQFFIENLQPSWLSNKAQRRQRWLYILGISLFGSLFSGFFVGLVGSLFYGLLVGLVTFMYDLMGTFIGYRVTDKVTWSGLKRDSLSTGLGAGFFASLVGALSIGLGDGLGDIGLVGSLFYGLFGSLVGVLSIGLFVGLFVSLFVSLESEQSANRLRPNQGINGSIKNGLVYGLVGGLGGGLVSGIGIGLLAGLFGILGFGGAAVIQHYLLRLTLRHQNLLPLRLVPFLNNMTDHLLLQNAGAYFRFFHRSMQEHFATLTPEDIDRLVVEIKNTTPSKSHHNS